MRNRIKAMRKKRALSQLKLSQLIGYKSASRLSRIENGTALVPKNKICDLAKALNVSERWLVTGENDLSYTIYTDGGCDVNPGGVGGYGAVIINNASGEMVELSGAYESTTNNRMELMAAIVALEKIETSSKVILYSDSQYLINTMVKEWQKNKNQDLWQKLDNVAKNKKIRWVWVRGHDGNTYNERCDKLATIAIKNLPQQKDRGYDGEVVKCEESTSTESAMSVDIRVDDFELNQSYDINEKCRWAIKEFKSSRKRFKDYLKLKTFGMDEWSYRGEEDLKDVFGQDRWNLLSSFFNTSKDIASCLRWKGRGLSFQDAIRKVLVDNEVSKLVAKKKLRQQGRKRYEGDWRE